MVVPTAVQELTNLYDEGEIIERDLAETALRNILRPWEFKPINYVPLGHGVVEQIAFKLRKKGILPQEEINDSLIIAETGLLNAILLISSDHHICDIDPTDLKIEMESCDVSAPLIASPFKIVNGFFQKR